MADRLVQRVSDDTCDSAAESIQVNSITNSKRTCRSHKSTVPLELCLLNDWEDATGEKDVRNNLT